MRIVGPNCLGLVTPDHGLALTSSMAMEIEALRPGGIGFISQSGALMMSMFSRAHASGSGFSACVSVGNQCDVEMCDVLEYMIDDARTGAICLYAEGFKHPARFLSLADRCRGAGKPLLLTKAGRSPAGVRAAFSHTASLAGSYVALSAACEAHGVLLLDDPDVMIHTADMILRWGVPDGDGIGVVSPSGGGAAVAVDRLGDAGLRLARLDVETRQRLTEVLRPPQADNPMDLGGRHVGDSVPDAATALAMLAADPDVDVLFAAMTTSPFYEEIGREAVRIARDAGKPLLPVMLPGPPGDGPRAAFRELDAPYVDRLDDGIRVLEALMSYAAIAAKAPAAPDMRRPDLPAAWDLAIGAGPLTIVEAAGLAKHWALPVARQEHVRDRDAAGAVAETIGYPVALKVVSRTLTHRSQAGGVALDLGDADAIRKGWDSIMSTVPLRAPSAAIEGCLLQAMHHGIAELLVGARHDDQFGPLITVDAGGTLVELLEDTHTAVAPVTFGGAAAMLCQLRIWPLLDGQRGHPAADVDAAVETIHRVSWLMAELGPRLTEFEINLLLLRLAGQGAVALDIRAHGRQQGG